MKYMGRCAQIGARATLFVYGTWTQSVVSPGVPGASPGWVPMAAVSWVLALRDRGWQDALWQSGRSLSDRKTGSEPDCPGQGRDMPSAWRG